MNPPLTQDGLNGLLFVFVLFLPDSETTKAVVINSYYHSFPQFWFYWNEKHTALLTTKICKKKMRHFPPRPILILNIYQSYLESLREIKTSTQLKTSIL